MTLPEDHPLRYELSNELHARPFPVLAAPCHAVFLAIKRPENAAGRDKGLDRAHLVRLLDRFGTTHPKEGATHFFGQLGRHRIKWECHTEFVTYTVFVEGTMERPFDGAAYEVFPEDWLAEAPGRRLTSALVRVEETPSDEAEVGHRCAAWFEADSVAISRVLDDSAIVATDFRIDATGHTRIAVFTDPGTGRRRLGRVVQRLLEIETYKTMSMLGLPVARELGQRMNGLETQLAGLVSALTAREAEAEQALHELLEVSAELEHMLARNGYRFGATEAYATIVDQRIDVLRESRFRGRQTLREFMMRRFDPAMRTCTATRLRLEGLTARAERAGNLLRTRVDVERSAQNQKLLESMDRRADLQLRLQRTVEGLSVVAISYYGVSLASYALAPLAGRALGIDKAVLTGLLVLPVVAAVWWIVQRVRKSMH
ncbi:DUF3422 family protein [Rhodovulum sp. YNF3179]|uniref:DUF3422 family protein n=1 Tax=Rhodovulum sp. YNF3179 TaxID=3425127 RepID=UPI003D3275D0